MSDSIFVYKADSGAEIKVPAFGEIPFGVVRRLRKEPDSEQFFALIETVVTDKKTMAAIDKLSIVESSRFYEAWQKHSSTSAGESSASPGS